ncbi:hypothetical protein PC9H_008175 [Pleurotus ostreatus]|uniref:Uncharacterized protein n=1 Tax=Pleurotus ostreatus TaxID=5322 RepID=A0A8H6ZWP3_PLEOS|nr:uncharacterized protein PC9H_008175 [Pleurotus ostreatus]KAF7428938.1 hypothetical protein PC9H_008175 [Pleurotus ostreatus]KAJ8697201.1 hypothetical protein PTI98_006999 [Pleurotus ostreatus]
MAYWSSMFPAPGTLSAIPWDDIYRSPTSFFVDSIIPVGSPHTDRIENMKCSSMIKLADRIRLVQQSERPNIFRAKADILRILRSSPSEAIAPKTPNMGVTIIDVDAPPSTPSPPQMDSSGELTSIAPEFPLALIRTSAIESSMLPLAADVLVDIIEPPRASGPSNTPRSSAKRKSTSFADNAGAAAFADGIRSPKKPRLSRASNGITSNTTPES